MSKTHIKRDGKTVCNAEQLPRRKDIPLSTISLNEMHKVKKDKYDKICPKCLKWYFEKCNNELIIIENE